MKKLVASLVLMVYLFNIGGELVLHKYFSYLSDRFFNEQTGKGLYNVSDLTEVKLPISMPGITDWTEYESVTGQIQFGNVSYNYVKMKITRNAIYLMCVPNYKSTRLFGDNIINAKGVKGNPVHKKEHVPYGTKTLIGKFNFTFLQFTFHPPFKSRVKMAAEPCPPLIHQALDIPEQPPKIS